MNDKKFSLKERINSFGFAIAGLVSLFKKEHNAQVHFLAAVLIIVLGFYFRISNTEWIALVFAIGFVFVTEAINTAIEEIANFVHPQKHEHIKLVKDLAAAAVLISAIAAVVIGGIIFAPKIV